MEGSVHRAARPADGNGGRSMQSLRSMARSAPRYALGRLNASEARPVSRKPGLTPVGVNRSLPQDVISQGEWSTSPEGKRVWRLTLTSADAEAMRVHFRDFHVGDGNVWLLGPDNAAATTGPYSKDGLLGDGEFWSDLVEGDSLTVLYEPADNSAVDTVPFSPSAIAHRFPSMIAKASSTQSAAASCNVDVTLPSRVRGRGFSRRADGVRKQ